MRVVVAPDKFAGTLTAREAAVAIRDGWLDTVPGDDIALLPLSDGGPGFLEVLGPDLGGHLATHTVRGPLGDPVPASLLVLPETGAEPATAYVEVAQAAGLALVDPRQRDARRASSYGVGELLGAAVDAGVRRIVVGVGGTASVDGGAGLLAALGAAPADLLAQGGSALRRLGDGSGVAPVLTAARERLSGVELVAATDVDAPLLGPDGAALGFAEQKGADRAARDELEAALRTWATATDGAVAVRGGAGAGGGIGFALLLLGATRVPGAQLVVDSVRLPDRALGADLLVTGEGSFDWQSLRGKVVAGVARVGQQTGRPTVVLAGRVEVGRRELSNAGIDAAYAVMEMPDREQDHTPAEQLRRLAARVARTWSRPAGRRV